MKHTRARRVRLLAAGAGVGCCAAALAAGVAVEVIGPASGLNSAKARQLASDAAVVSLMYYSQHDTFYGADSRELAYDRSTSDSALSAADRRAFRLLDESDRRVRLQFRDVDGTRFIEETSRNDDGTLAIRLTRCAGSACDPLLPTPKSAQDIAGFVTSTNDPVRPRPEGTSGVVPEFYPITFSGTAIVISAGKDSYTAAVKSSDGAWYSVDRHGSLGLAHRCSKDTASCRSGRW